MVIVIFLKHLFYTGESEERSMIEPLSREDPKLKDLIKVSNIKTFQLQYYSCNTGCT